MLQTLINTGANHPSKHCQPTETTDVQFAIWQNQIMDGTNIRTTMYNRNGLHVHRTSWEPRSLVGKNTDNEESFLKKLVLHFKHATIKLYLTLSHVGLVAHRTLEVMTWIPGLSCHKTCKLLAETCFNGSAKQASAESLLLKLGNSFSCTLS